MPVDASTLLIAITVVHLAGGILFFLVWRLFSNRFEAQISSIGIWSLTHLFLGLGNVMVGLRTFIPDWASIVMGNALLLFGIGLARMAISVFFGRKPYFTLAALPGLLWLALCAYPPFLENTTARIIAVQFALGSSLVWISLLCFTRNRDNLYTARLNGMTTFVLAAGSAYYAINAYAASDPSLPFIFQHDFAKIYLLVALLCTVAAIILIFAMIIEKEQLFFRTQARMDPLTGLSNRRAFGEMIRTWIESQDSTHAPFAIAIFDIDEFKAANDKYGQVLGDAILQLLARICEDSAREDRIFASHLNGDCFAVFYGGIPIGKAALLAEEIRRQFAKSSESATDGRLPATLSAGLSGGDIRQTEIQDALRAADLALANAKRRGRNRLAMSMITAEKETADSDSAPSERPASPGGRQDISRRSKVA
ncbi:GGDEF domain-containing protein [Roseibium aggregatum]|uniref:diguanylate cyclase n=1 Tax=Roseibium aggregatum TaxID=187304 RepID=A0A926NRL5_9HYPH|nr:GGDEF domain-containing protein [Roseibium aggregatum]MBD1546087.1 GGDEF domain-containing protein [Roseibium aggregatum]